jgi:hypothetical protein
MDGPRYPKIRVDKLHPDGSPRAAWEAYRIEDHEGAVRVWTPARTPRVHVNGAWTPDSPFVTAWVPGEPYVVACYEDADGIGLYIDIVRECRVAPTSFAYVDLYVDVILKNGRVVSKDEELLNNLANDEARSVLAIRDRLVRRVRSGEPPFSPGDPRWHVSVAARALVPGAPLTLS